MIAQVCIALLCLLSSSFAFPAPVEPEPVEKLQFSLDNGADVAFTKNGSIINVGLGDITVTIFGDIGRIVTSQANGTQTLSISAINIAELNENYLATGHNFSLVDALYTVDALFSASIDGVNVTAANLTTPLIDGSTLVLTVLVLSDGGEVSVGSEMVTANAGSIKLMAEVRDWPFCEGNSADEACKDIGKSIEITFDVTGRNATIGRVGNNSLGFGMTNTTNFTMTWAQEVLVNDELQPLELGYPVLANVNENVTQVTFGFPQFNSSAILELVIIDNDQRFLLNPIGSVSTNLSKLDIFPRLFILSEIPEPQASVNIFLANIRELNLAQQPIGVADVGAISQHAQNGLFGSLLEATQPISTKFGNATCQAVNVSGPLRAYATANVTNYLFTNTAQIMVNNATFDVDESTMLMMLGVRNWSFCEANGEGFNQCSDSEIGSSLEIEFEVSSYRQILVPDKNNRYKLGKSIIVTLPTQILVDGFFLNMEQGYPRVNLRDGRSFVVIRVPKFATEAQYGALFRVRS